MEDAQQSLDLAGRPVAGVILHRIRTESRDESEKGRWFEQLFMRVACQQPDFEIDGIWRWADWPEREELTGLDARDIGIDLVAHRLSGEWVAIQCKCYDDQYTLGKGEIDKFLGGSQNPVFRLRWIVATCRWGPNAERAIQNAHPQVSQIDFREYLSIHVEEQDTRRPVQKPWSLQMEAIETVVTGLANHDRGRLIMACGTGKTFTALRIAEQIVEDGQRILFVTPTIALVSQARHEWLRQTTRRLECIVVCSDSTAGGRHENEDIRISELECPVTTDPVEIAYQLTGDGATRTVFCTYQSLRKVIEAQAHHGVPAFDLAIADEAHRTTGVLDGPGDPERKVSFQEFHDDSRLHAHKRLYMTATPRIYTGRSKGKLAARGIEVVDMSDYDVYGPELHKLSFKEAVDEGALSDYRVIVLGVSKASVTPALRRRLEELDTSTSRNQAPNSNDMTRMLGVSLAVNGVTEGNELEQPGRLPRAMAFANSIRRSKWYAGALMESEVLRATTRRMQEGRAMKVVAKHLDASASALQRNQELRALAHADRDGECRIVCNVKLFTEGVDVPSLDAVAFLDPRNSQVDVVQAVGRVMRRAPGKRFGYIIIPVVVEPRCDVVEALEHGTEGYRTVGQVLRALQAHDGRLAETPARFIKVYEPIGSKIPGDRNGDGPGVSKEEEQFQGALNLKEAGKGIFAHVAAASGLGKPGQIIADEITDAVKRASAVLQEEELEEPLAYALGLIPEDDGGAKGICTVAALILCNACLLQRRLRDEPEMRTIMRLDKVTGASHPKEVLEIAWETILEKDYMPIFKPALTVLSVLHEGEAINNVIRKLAECANRVADSLSELGYDHAGPLYHRILGSAKSDGAFYTNNLSAIMLARLALDKKFIDWSDFEAVSNLRIIDPACGTGTLLMAVLKTIKAHVTGLKEMNTEERNALHKTLVENVLCGLDINQHGIQLAACNLTLGAPTVDYERMNLATMPHGPQSDGSLKAGSLEILTASNAPKLDLSAITTPQRNLDTLDAAQVSESEEIRFPLHDLDAVIMNAPFTDNTKRNRKYGEEVVQEMQQHELDIRNMVLKRDQAAGHVITSNSIRTFFTPLADQLLRNDRGVLAKVIPVTACTGASGVDERRFLAERFHIERIVTTHDPKRINFSENTSIHECLLICRRWPEGDRPPTEFVSLREMPGTMKEAIEAADAIAIRKLGQWGSTCHWPAYRVRSGDWTPVQWYDHTLAEAAWDLEKNTLLEPVGQRFQIGPPGQAIRGAYTRCDEETPGAVQLFWSVSSKLRRTMYGEPEDWRCPKIGKGNSADGYWNKRSCLLVSARYDTISGRLTALWTPSPSVGSGWVPISVGDENQGKALAAWWNSTPVRLMLLNQRSKKLTYPTWAIAQLRQIRIPKPDNPAWDPLRTAFDQVSNVELLPMRQAEECHARQVIDEAAAMVLGVDLDVLADWRQRLAAEPTISNTRAKELGVEK